jgi:hypothetical protein
VERTAEDIGADIAGREQRQVDTAMHWICLSSWPSRSQSSTSRWTALACR